MANFLVVVDPDPARREAYCTRVRPLLAPVDGLVTQTIGAGACAVLWAAGPRAPIDHAVDGDTLAAIWGRAVPVGATTPVTARDAADAWATVGAGIPPVWDGYFAAITYDPRRGLVVGADILGYFPVYWWHRDGVTLVGASPELFRHHPLFQLEVDPMGLAAILLVMHSIRGRTLLKGVQRLTEGHLLHVPADAGPQERLQYRMPYSTTYYDWPIVEHLNVVDEALENCMRRQIPDEPTGMLLSGGLDSRVLAGFLKRRGNPTTALTFGLPSDFEADCAAKVASTMGFTHRVEKIELEPAIPCAERHAQWCHLVSGFSSIASWNSRDDLSTLPPYFVAGYALDTAMAAGYTGRSYDPETRTMSWDNYSKHVLAWGLGVDRLRRMLRPEIFGQAVDENLAMLRETYDGYSEFPSKRHWIFGMLNRMRFHVAQPSWIYSFASWPVLPVLDQHFLEVIGGLPPATVGYRRAQFDLVKTRFPELARLPLDRNSGNRLPIEPAWYDLLRQRIEWRARPLLARLPGTAKERRYYHRLYSLDSPGWREIRRHAAPHVPNLDALFHADELAEYVPAPDVPIPLTDTFGEASGRKLILGLALWSRDHLGSDQTSSPQARSTVRCTAAS